MYIKLTQKHATSLQRLDQILLRIVGVFGLILFLLAAPDIITLYQQNMSGPFGICFISLPTAILISLFVPKLAKAAAVLGSFLFLLSFIAWSLGLLDPLGLIDSRPWATGFPGAAIGLAAVSMRGRRAISFGLFFAAVMLVMPLMPAGFDRAWSNSWQDALLAAALAVVICEPVIALRKSAVAADRALHDLMEQYASSALRRAADSERSNAERVFHDHVLGVLYLASKTPNTISPEQLQMQIRLSREALAEAFAKDDSPGMKTPAELIAALTVIASSGSIALRCISGLSSALQIPLDLFDALRDATAEAVRNAVKHAPGSTVNLEFRASSDSISIIVSDDGPGFYPELVDPRRMGIKGSIVDRVNSAGGKTKIRSAPGQGTQIQLLFDPAL